MIYESHGHDLSGLLYAHREFLQLWKHAQPVWIRQQFERPRAAWGGFLRKRRAKTQKEIHAQQGAVFSDMVPVQEAQAKSFRGRQGD